MLSPLDMTGETDTAGIGGETTELYCRTGPSEESRRNIQLRSGGSPGSAVQAPLSDSQRPSASANEGGWRVQESELALATDREATTR